MLVIALPIMLRDPHWLHVVIMIGIAIMLAASLRISLIAGVFNLGQIAFYAIGAYTLALLMNNLGLSFWLCLLIAGVVAGLIALAIGYLTIRVRGVYFVMVSLALVEIVRSTIIALPFLGGYKVVVVPTPNPIIVPHLFSVEFVSKVPYYYLVLVLIAITIFVLYRIENSRIGAILKSIMDSEPLAMSIGINSVAYRVLAFCISSFFAGIAGAFYASYAGVIGPQGFNIWASIIVFIMIVVGGIGSVWGPVIGAALLTLLPEVLADIPDYEPIVYSIFVILVFFFIPEGLIGLPRLVKAKVLEPVSAKFIKGKRRKTW
jgi:branched-chain amino acid transport system permease protein